MRDQLHASAAVPTGSEVVWELSIAPAGNPTPIPRSSHDTSYTNAGKHDSEGAKGFYLVLHNFYVESTKSLQSFSWSGYSLTPKHTQLKSCPVAGNKLR
jgi:hypothetical protein